MRWLFQLVMTAAGAIGAVYVLFFIDLGGQSLFSHLCDVWRSPVVQGKVNTVEKSLADRLSDRLAQARQQGGSAGAAARTGQNQSPGGEDQLSPTDRQSLNDLVSKIAQTNH